jgi:hypothetical protein
MEDMMVFLEDELNEFAFDRNFEATHVPGKPRTDVGTMADDDA